MKMKPQNSQVCLLTTVKILEAYLLLQIHKGRQKLAKGKKKSTMVPSSQDLKKKASQLLQMF